MITRYWLSRTIQFGVVLSLLVACTATQELTVQPSVTTVTFLPLAVDHQYYVELAATFNAQHPSIHVEVLHSPEVAPRDPAQNVMEYLGQCARVADIFTYSDLATTILAESGLVQNLQQFLENDADFVPDDIFTPLLAGYRDATGLWGSL